MDVALRGADVGVAENIFYDVDVGAPAVHPGSKGMTQIMEAEIRPANSFTRRIERSPDRTDASLPERLVRFASLLVDWVAAHAIATVDAEDKYRPPQPIAADIASEFVEVVAHTSNSVGLRPQYNIFDAPSRSAFFHWWIIVG